MSACLRLPPQGWSAHISQISLFSPSQTRSHRHPPLTSLVTTAIYNRTGIAFVLERSVKSIPIVINMPLAINTDHHDLRRRRQQWWLWFTSHLPTGTFSSTPASTAGHNRQCGSTRVDTLPTATTRRAVGTTRKACGYITHHHTYGNRKKRKNHTRNDHHNNTQKTRRRTKKSAMKASWNEPP